MRRLTSFSSVVSVVLLAWPGAGSVQAHVGDHERWEKSDALHAHALHGRFPAGDPAVGMLRSWPTVSWDSEIVLKEFRLRAVGPHIEIWVPTGDMRVDSDECRSSNAADLVVTDSQVRYLVGQFERVIRPLEGRVFGFPTPRDGRNAQPELIDPAIPADAFRGRGDRVVVLVDNIRAGGLTLPISIEATDRNLLIVRASAWATTLGPRPIDLGPTPCRNQEGFAIEHEIEGLLAHEYNHVIWNSRSPDPGGLWPAEGTAEWVRSLIGYRDAAEDSLAMLVVGCFQGRAAEMFPPGYGDPFGVLAGGPENSLSVFDDPGQSGFCDYGAAELMIHLVAERYGERFVRDLLFASGSSDMDRLERTLIRHRARQGAAALLEDWAAMSALDGILDDGAQLTGAKRKRFQARSLHSTINFDTPFAYARPGAPPNGADFVRLRDAEGDYLDAGSLRSLRFDAPNAYPPQPLEWSVDADGHGSGDPALYSGSGDADSRIDRSIVMAMAVDPAQPTLSFDTRFDIEPGYDLGVVQVSTDGGATFTSRPAAATTTVLESDALATIAAELPGFSGDSGGWIHQTVDLSDVAGREVLVRFRYMTDSFVNHPGLWIDSIRMGGALVSDGSTLDGWTTPAGAPIAGIGVRLIAYSADHRRAWVADMPLNAANDGELSARRLHDLLGRSAETVAAIVTHYEPSERILSPAPYRLTVNGRLQPGG